MTPSTHANSQQSSVAPAAVANTGFGLADLVAYIAAAVALWIVITTINITAAGWVALPCADDWDRWITYLQYHYSLKWFFLQHVDHRIAAPKVLFAIDHLVFHARAWFVQVCTLLFQALTAFLLWHLAGRAYSQDRTERIVQASFVVSCLFAGEQWMNFIRLFQVQFPMVYFFAAAALFALWKSSESNRGRAGRWLAVCIAMATLSLWSMANGLLIWPVLILAAVWLRMPRREIAAITAGMIIFGGLYLYGWRRSTPPISFDSVPRILLFLLDHLGAPAGILPGLPDMGVLRMAVAAIMGALVGVALVIVFVMLWRRRERFSGAQAVLFFFAVFLGLTSASMAYGRYGSPLAEHFAFNSRYSTIPYILWATMLVAGWPWLRRMKRVVLYAVLCIFLFFGIVYRQNDGLGIAKLWTNITRQGAAGIADQVIDPDPWHILYHTPALAMDTINYLRTNRLSIFTEEWTRWPGIPLTSRFSIDRNPDACQGGINQTVFVSSNQPGWRITGWGWDTKAILPPRYIVLADQQGKVAGIALEGFMREVGLPSVPPQYPNSTWIGYVNGEARPITAYVLEEDNRSLCPIGTVNAAHPIREAGMLELGPRLPDSTPEINGPWVADGYLKGPGGPVAPPFDGPTFGTYPAATVGTIRLGPFHLDGHTRIAIPLVTGPAADQTSVIIRDPNTKAVMAKLDPAVPHTTWWFWRPDLPQDVPLNIEIIAENKGSGQWQAIGWPHSLRELPLRDVAFSELGPPLPDVKPETTGTWVQDGYYKGPDGPGTPPAPGPVFGSYPPDNGTGTIRLGPFHLNRGSQIAIPLVTGPDHHGLAIMVRDAVTGIVLVQLEPSVHSTWWIWRPDLPQDRELNIEITAEDNGTNWGQWLALCWPHFLKR